MIKTVNFLLALLLSQAVIAQSTGKNIGGVTLPSTLKTEKANLVLNGGGIREKYFIDMYVGGLYLPKKSSDAEMIIKSEQPTVLRIHIVSSLISSDKMSSAVDEGFEKSTSGNQEKFKEKISVFKDVFNREPIKKGDVFDIIYIPEQGTVIHKNNKEQAGIKGSDFKQALFGIWLGKEPADEDLKEGMLGLE